MLYNKQNAQTFPGRLQGPGEQQRKIMKALVLTAFLASVSLSGAAAQTSQQQDQEQKKSQQAQPAQAPPAQAHPAAVAISPLISVANPADGSVPPKDVAPGSPGAAVM